MSREADSQAVRIGGESELPSQEPGKAGLYCTVLCKGNDKRDVVQRTKRVEFRITGKFFMPRLSDFACPASWPNLRLNRYLKF